MQDERASARPPLSRRALAALFAGLLPVPVGVFLGWSALNRIRREGERGRPLAIAAILVSAASFVGWFVLPGALSAVEDSAHSEERVAVPVELGQGDCFTFGTGTDRDRSRMNKRACDEGHDGEVIGVFVLHGADDGDSYPGQDAIKRRAEEECAEFDRSYAHDGRALAEGLQVGWLFPAKENWFAGQRKVICFYEPPAKA
ncbi:DUF4190 domain-containing protein [Streptomyces sp. NPDC051940]|uniref:DUF4190 domain-containing protein n=1 Tax=Streptomyces sp. NPDC051940 TaxID=3155675 RepID=UPI003427CCA5